MKTTLFLAPLLIIASVFFAPKIAAMYGVYCHTCNINEQIEAEARMDAANSGISVDDARQRARALYNHCGENPGQATGSVYYPTPQARQEAKAAWNKYYECGQAFLKDHPHPYPRR